MVPTEHQNNIFCARFTPEDESKVISCGADGQLHLTDIKSKKSHCRYVSPGMLMKIEFVPGQPHSCCTSGQDGQIRLHDLRTKSAGSVLADLDPLPCASNIAFSPAAPSAFVIGSSDMYCRMYDIRGGDRLECLWKFNPPIDTLLAASRTVLCTRTPNQNFPIPIPPNSKFLLLSLLTATLTQKKNS